jgi:hypothetical protein
MALASTIDWEVRTTGSDSNGGGFDTAKAGTDYSQQDAAQATGVNLTVDATTNTKVTPDGYTPNASTDPGNVIQITTTGGGAAFTTGFYEITSVTGGEWVLDRSPAATSSSGAHWSFGGGLASPGMASGAAVGSNIIYLKSGTYNCSSSDNVSGGKFTLPGGSSAACTTLVGYSTTRTLTNTDTKPILQSATSTNNNTICTTNSDCTVRNIDFENANSDTGCTAISTGANLYVTIENCKINGYKTGIDFIVAGGSAVITGCEIILANEANAIGINDGNQCYIGGCYIHGGTSATSNGIVTALDCTIDRTIIANITGSTSNGINVGGRNPIITNCTIYNVSQDGIINTGGTNQGGLVRDTIVASCGRYGLNMITAVDNWRVLNLAGYNNTTANTNATTTLGAQNTLALSATPFTNAGSGDFSLNNSAGGGAVVRGAGYPGTYPGGSSVSSPDIGAVQTASAAPAGPAPAFVARGDMGFIY